MKFAVRWLLPIVVIAGGIVAMALVGPDDERYLGGVAIIGAGLAIWLLNYFYRLSASAQDDRAAEEEAREYFDRHGRWPDENPR
ncbi:MAG: hypothetical protein JWM73_2514 [Solirubrobacterales bacterium]|nr:hypothetical protein [Solirubrobacterales bacterium]